MFRIRLLLGTRIPLTFRARVCAISFKQIFNRLHNNTQRKKEICSCFARKFRITRSLRRSQQVKEIISKVSSFFAKVFFWCHRKSSFIEKWERKCCAWSCTSTQHKSQSQFNIFSSRLLSPQQLNGELRKNHQQWNFMALTVHWIVWTSIELNMGELREISLN